ncbi:hypothetical protein ABFS82_08G031500 [Erythranthe guttata]|uniref:Ninja-family protein n=1 Tax=Erythranthe guttata TaxID=4155 RepID=A0A022RUK9_ERYGU|nr:PREDICTED: ninja-family protein AFP3 [Erythranthe guttata]EYU44202.1 hypothetical protein MIMGU_mgv1a011530mg [Erythranthe guttata]|eukprot:XP_012851704.1 PREDICTED: ninja-family protein AFP3 [Erythranthe guttata]
MERGEGNKENLIFSTDLLNNFIKRGLFVEYEDEQRREDEEMELSLGLSMNGRFGVDPTRKVLDRSSSISDMASVVCPADNGIGDHARGVEIEKHAPPLARTHSLPIQTEEEWRRRKELQCAARMKKNSAVVVDDADTDSSNTTSGMKGVVYEIDCGDDQKLDQFINGNVTPLMPIEHLIDGNSDPPSHQTEACKVGPTTKTETNAAAMPEMPYVTTKEAGANGKKVEGFLYKYRKGGVKIVCVCHGLFLTPAQFLNHGGFHNVDHPLKHIVVNPFPLF